MFPKHTRVILQNDKEYHLIEYWNGQIVVKPYDSEKPLEQESDDYASVVSEYRTVDDIAQSV